jgi:recombinational DNA repair protein RecT
MSIDECYAIRDRSEAFKKGSGPWKTDEGEMIKKTILKREYKTWPKTDKSHRMDNAVEIINEHEGVDFSNQFDDKPINWQNVEEGYIRAIECVDCADPLEGSNMARQLMINLTPDEQIAVNNKLKGYKPGKRQYNTLFSDCLNYDEIEEPNIPEHMQ